MKVDVLDELLRTVDVRLHAVATCELAQDSVLVFPAQAAALVHFGLEGEGLLELETSPRAVFRAGEVVIVPGGAQATMAAPGEGPRTFSTIMEGSRLGLGGLLRFTGGHGAPVVRTVCAVVSPSYAGGLDLFQHLTAPLVQEAGPGLAPAFDLMLGETREPGFGARAVVEAAMRLILLLVLRRHLAEPGVAGPLFAGLRDPRLVRAVSAILRSPGGDHTVQTLAAEAGMSRPVFAERFSKTFGQTPIDFLQKVRLRHAARLLQVTPLPVKTIAESVGFASRSHFSRAFRQTFGLDPTRYRRKFAPEQT